MAASSQPANGGAVSAKSDMAGRSPERMVGHSDGRAIDSGLPPVSHGVTRRRFLAAMGSLGLLGLVAPLASISVPAAAAQRHIEPFWNHPRSLSLYRPATGQRWSGVYWRNGHLDPAGYSQVCHLLRDHRANIAVAMSPRLLDLLCAIQAWVRPYGFHEPITITSGYRTPQSNANLEGAARNSMHMRGAAVDLRIPGLPINYLGALAQHYSAGGVGFYLDSGFVHLDTGRVRTWRQ